MKLPVQFNPRCPLIASGIIALTAASLHAAIEVPNDVDHVISGTVTGTLVAIDVPTLALPQNFTTVAPGGPTWTTGTPAGTIAHAADNGFYVQTTIGDSYTTRGPHGRAPWEPDGTPLAEGGHYGAYNGTDPEVSYLFNLADSGIAIPDGAVINAVYMTWNTRGKDNANISYAEGADTGTVNVQFPTAPVDDLVLRWYDDTGTGHDGDFQRIITGPITVTGGDGFRLDVVRQPNTAHVDAVIIDVSGIGPPPASFPLVITPNDPTSRFKLDWESQAGMLYRVLSNNDLGTPIDTWSEVAADIAATPPSNTYNVDPADPALFYAVEEYPAPPMEIFAENFDGTTPGSLPADWASGSNPADNSSLTSWELGTPANVGPVPPGVPLPSAANCVATNISGNYDDPVSDLGVAHTDIWLRTPSINLGAATEGTLSFQQWTQIEDVAGDLDYGSIRILDASDDSELAVLESQSIDGTTTGWEEYSKALPPAAFTATAGTIKIEFQFEADDIDSFAGWYIDDVVVTTP